MVSLQYNLHFLHFKVDFELRKLLFTRMIVDPSGAALKLALTTFKEMSQKSLEESKAYEMQPVLQTLNELHNMYQRVDAGQDALRSELGLCAQQLELEFNEACSSFATDKVFLGLNHLYNVSKYDQLTQILSQGPDGPLKNYFLRILALKYLKAEDAQKALICLKEIKSSFDRSVVQGQLARLYFSQNKVKEALSEAKSIENQHLSFCVLEKFTSCSK